MPSFNKCPNPGLANNDTGWLSNTRTREARATFPRGFAIRTTWTGAFSNYTGSALSASASGQVWSACIVVEVSRAQSVTVSLAQYNNGSYLSTVGGSTTALAANTPTVIVRTATLTAGNQVDINVDGSSAQSGDIFYVGGARQEQINNPSITYADGDTAGWIWDGTAGNSSSQSQDNVSKSGADTVAITDTQSGLRTSTKSDTLAITDDKTLAITSTQTDQISITEQTPQIAQTKSDDFTITDTSSVFKSTPISSSDSFSITDSAILDVFRTSTDTLQVTESSALTVSQQTSDSIGLTESPVIGISSQDLLGLTETTTDRTFTLDDTLTLDDPFFNNAEQFSSDSMTITDQSNLFFKKPTAGFDLVDHPEKDDELIRVIAQDIFTKQFLHWDLPITDLQIKYTISGPQVISGKFETEIQHIRDIGLEPERVRIHVEEDGEIRASGILMPFSDDNKGKIRTIEAEGNSTYPHWIVYQGPAYQGIQVDPADMIRKLWNHVQSYTDSNLGVQVSSTTTPVRIGTEPQNVEFETGAGEQVSFVAGPYALNFWTVTNCGDEIRKLCQETPIEYLERSSWNAGKTDVLHYIDLGYPRVGRRRTDLSFREGENMYDLIPTYAENKDNRASVVIVVGAGDGEDAIREMTSGYSDPRRLRKTRVIQNEDITSRARALTLSQFEFRRTNLSRYEIKSISIDTSHDNAPWGSFQCGDDILVEGTVPYIGKIADLHRIVSYTYNPRNKVAVLDLLPSESFDYGALKVGNV